MMEPSREATRVTDHAVLRYLERGMGLNVEIVREHILQICATPAAFGASAVRTEGLKFEIVDNTVVTVVPDAQRPSRTSQRRNSAVYASGVFR